MTLSNGKNKKNKYSLVISGKAVMYVLFIVCLSGVLAGTLICINSGESDFSKANTIISCFFSNRLGQTFIGTVVNSFSSTFVLLLICFFLGFGALFQPLEFAAVFFRGLGIGFTISEIIWLYRLQGLLAAAVLLIPYAIASSIIFIAAAKEALWMSNSIAGIVFFHSNQYSPVDYRLYMKKFIIMTILLVVISFADGIINYAFAGLWSGLLGK